MRTFEYEGKIYNILKEYQSYYLCERIYKGKSLYRECFSKVDVDGVQTVKVVREASSKVGWYSW